MTKDTGWTMTDYQMDIFGDAVAVEDIDTRMPRSSIKSRFRKMYGFDDEHICKDCKYCVYTERDKRWYKCLLMGVSASEATDIRLKDTACTRWEKSDG